MAIEEVRLTRRLFSTEEEGRVSRQGEESHRGGAQGEQKAPPAPDFRRRLFCYGRRASRGHLYGQHNFRRRLFSTEEEATAQRWHDFWVTS